MSLDFKLGFRMLAKYPGLTLVGGLAIAFAICVGAVGFELGTQLMYPKLPLDEGERIVAVQNRELASRRVQNPTLRDVATWRIELPWIENLGAFRRLDLNLIVGDRAHLVAVAEISASAFPMARVSPLFGRPLVAEDEHPGAAPVAVISHELWQRHFDADPTIVGRSIRLGQAFYTVVGVMPKGFEFPTGESLWIPLGLDLSRHQGAEGPEVRVFGRLARGTTMTKAQAKLTALGERAATDALHTRESLRPEIEPYAKSILSLSGEPAAVLLVNVFLILLLVFICGNVALLMFARAATREGEIAVRHALGASRRRIIGQFFAEALVLAGVAATVGLIAADLGLRWRFGLFDAMRIQGQPAFWDRNGLTPATVLYGVLLAVLAAVIAGVMPAAKVTHDLRGRLQQTAPGGSRFRFGGVWTAVVVCQIVAMVALPVLAFFLRGEAADLRSIDFGFPKEQFLSAQLEIDRETALGAPVARSRTELLAQRGAIYRELESRLEADPAVVGVTFTDGPALVSRAPRRIELDPSGAAPADSASRYHRIKTASVAPDYFDLVNAPILTGRGFHSGDVESDARVVIVNQSFVETVLGGLNPIGRRVRYVQSQEAHDPGESEPWHEIIGVVRDIGRPVGNDGPERAGLYHPVAPGAASSRYVALHVRGKPDQFAARLQSVAASVDPALRLWDVLPLDELRRFDLYLLKL